MTILRFFSIGAYDEAKTAKILTGLQQIDSKVSQLQTEKCYHIEVENDQEIPEFMEYILRWLLKCPQERDNLTKISLLDANSRNEFILEIGPRFNFSTADSSNSVSICHNVGLTSVKRVEVSIRYLVSFKDLKNDSMKYINQFTDYLGDRMTQCLYTEANLPRSSFDEQLPKTQESWYFVPVLEHGKRALIEVNKKLGLAFDAWDLDYYTTLFRDVLKRDPTSVELFDCAQSNSEHSRHWFFKGKMIIDGVPNEKSLIKMIIDTQNTSNQNNTIKFSDNSSAIKGFTHKTLRPTISSGPGKMKIATVTSDLIFTAETHNMPTAVAPFSGATTGTGGRIRDVQGVGRGGLTIAGTAGYCVGTLNIPKYELSYELKNVKYPPSFDLPLKILIGASDGASDYGNKFGEPVISGFAISYGIRNAEQERDEYVKPIMFSGGLGTMISNQSKKVDPSKGILLAKIGGPVYRIGVGGGAASSVEVQGDNSSDLDFNAVQRGDAEMENKLNRVVRACIEMGDCNPILAIHDQGAGGNGNVLKELVEPGYAGAVIFSKEFQLGDPTITALELWGAEYQENNAILCHPRDRDLLEEICKRERCPICFVGIVTDNGFVTLVESEANFDKYMSRDDRDDWENLPFDMHLEDVLGDMPRKEFNLNTIEKKLEPIVIPQNTGCYNNVLKNVLSLMTVGSKRFLTNKVDRCVTGLIAQQQCVGPLHTPLADYAVTAVSHFGYEGIATSIGTQPIKGLISSKAGARMSVAEALSNLVFAGISSLADVKCSGNWMWAAKLPGEGAKLYKTCEEMCQIMQELNIAVDGGKDSLSMAARVDGVTIKSPGTLVVSTYVQCPDIRVKITPDFKLPARNKIGELVFIQIENKFRLGGSAFAQSIEQQGDDCPDLDKSEILKSAFEITQKLLKEGKLLAGHDVSDGGLIVCLLEMAFGGFCGLKVDISTIYKSIDKINIENNNTKIDAQALAILFAEETGWVLEVNRDDLLEVITSFKKASVPIYHIGNSCNYGLDGKIKIVCQNNVLIDSPTMTLLQQWERTSFEIEKLQMNEKCAIEEFKSFGYRTGPDYTCTFNPDEQIIEKNLLTNIRVAVIREEGSNGDREMIATLMTANFEVHDVTMYDLLNGKTTLDQYRGVVFPGGFSYADTLGSAKGWAATIMYSDLLSPQFLHFKNREDTFSLGVCNGCQLMSLIGWVGTKENERIIPVPNVALLHNQSGRYECRWTSVKIEESKAIMLRRMSGTVIGCWIAHGEGRFSFKSDQILNELKENNCVALHYVDDDNNPTEIYPMNPNGSTDGIAGICSNDGRHLAIMPHPERCNKMWQWPYVPPEFNYEKSPWQTMFDEAYLWCTENH